MAFGLELGASVVALLSLVRRIFAAGGFADAGPLQANCFRLARKVSLLSHLLEEIRDSAVAANPTPPSFPVASSSSRISPSSFLADLTAALEAVERFLLLSCRSPPADASSVSPRPQPRTSSLPSSPPPHLPRPSSLPSSSQVPFGFPRPSFLPSSSPPHLPRPSSLPTPRFCSACCAEQRSSLFSLLCAEQIRRRRARSTMREEGREGGKDGDGGEGGRRRLTEGGGGQEGSRMRGRESEAREEFTRSAAGAEEDKCRGRLCRGRSSTGRLTTGADAGEGEGSDGGNYKGATK